MAHGGKLSNLLNKYTVVAALICSSVNSWGADAVARLETDGEAKAVPYFQGTGPALHGRVFLFPNFEKLGQLSQENGYRDLREIFENGTNSKGQSGEDSYRSSKGPELAAFFNYAAKMSVTRFSEDNSSVLDHVIGVIELGRRSAYLRVDSRLAELANADPTVHYGNKIDARLMHPAPDGYRTVGNYKTHDARLPLHFTIYTNGQEYVMRVHVDKFKDGFMHVADEVVPGFFCHKSNPSRMGDRLKGQGMTLLYMLHNM